MELSEDLRDKIELVLKRQLISVEHGNIESFLDFSEADVAEIRALELASGVLAVSYIRYRMTAAVTLDRAVSYYASVIQQGISVDEWLNN